MFRQSSAARGPVRPTTLRFMDRIWPTGVLVTLVLLALWVVLALSPSLLCPLEAHAATPSVRLSSKRAAIEKGTAIRFTITWTGSEPATATVSHQQLVNGHWVTRPAKPKNVALNPSDATDFRMTPTLGRHRYRVAVIDGGERYVSKYREIVVVGRRVVALTFDDGPWRRSTPSIVSTLKRYDARSTFYMCGYAIKAYRDEGKLVALGGHEIGNHTWSHPVLTRLSSASVKSQLSSTQRNIQSRYGATPKTFRPPYGATSERVRDIARKQGLRQTLWTVDSLDWKYRSSSTIKSRVLRQVHRDAIVLFHDGGGDRAATAAALPGILSTLKARGYHFVTVSELNEIKRYR